MNKAIAALIAVVVILLIVVAFLMGRQQRPPAPSYTTPQAHAPGPPQPTAPDLSALDGLVADYNVDLRQIDQYEQQIAAVNQQEHTAFNERSYEVMTAASKQAIALMDERSRLGQTAQSLYQRISADPHFSTSYRETTYTTAHGVETLAGWSNLRYIERR